MKRFELFIARDAEKDLDSIYRYIASADGADQAGSIEERLLAAIKPLEHSPARGKIPQEMQSLGVTDFREIQSQSWRIFYYINNNQVGVVAILDARRNVAELLTLRLLQ